MSANLVLRLASSVDLAAPLEVKFETRRLFANLAFGRPVAPTSVFVVDACLGHRCPGCPRIQPHWDFGGDILQIGQIAAKLASDAGKGMVVRASGGDPLRYPREV